VPLQARPDLIFSDRNTLFLSGTLGRYSRMLTSVLEYPGKLYGQPVETELEMKEAQKS
jgi:hypothetical protein